MELFVSMLFRFLMYAMLGLSLETVFSVAGISIAAQCPIERRKPKRYAEGFVSLYMIPVHGLGVLFIFEPVSQLIAPWNPILRYVIYAILIGGFEALAGWIYDKCLGFYPWDYYADSKFKVFPRGYTLWTLLPLWGIYGFILEIFMRIVNDVAPRVYNMLW